MNHSDQVLTVTRAEIRPSPLNPRKHFNEGKLDELGLNIRKHGVIQPLTVRVRPATEEYPHTKYELIAGECRWRASGERPHPEDAETMAALEDLPILIREVDDVVALELMLSENMQRQDLTEIEESDAFAFATEQRHATGERVYPTLQAFADKIGVKVAVVQDRLRLRHLPKAGRKALEEGIISYTTARVISASPKEIIDKLLDVVLNPKKLNLWTGNGYRTEPLDAELTQQIREEHFMMPLKNTPFQLNDEKLFPQCEEDGETVGGACTKCMWNSANRGEDDAERTGGRGRPRGQSKSCLKPSCYRRKVEIYHAAALIEAEKKGWEVLNPEESAKALARNSKYVRLDERVDPQDLNGTLALSQNQTPTWEKIVNGKATAKVVVSRDAKGDANVGEVEGDVAPPIVVAKMTDGSVVKLVERKLAFAAAEKVGTSHLLSLSAGSRSQQGNEWEAKQREEQRLKRDVSFAAMAEVVAAVEKGDEPEDLPDWLIRVARWHGSGDAGTFTLKRRGLEASDYDRGLNALEKKLTNRAQKLGLAVELLIGRQLKFSGVSDNGFKALAKMYGVDVTAIEKRIRGERSAAKKEKAKNAKEKEKADAKKKAKAEPKGDDPKKAPILKEIGHVMVALKIPGEELYRLADKHGKKKEGRINDMGRNQLTGLLNELKAWEPAHTPAGSAPAFVQCGARVLVLDRMEGNCLICEDPFHERGKHPATFDIKEEAKSLKPAKPAYVESEFQRLGVPVPADIEQRCPTDIKKAIKALQLAPAAPAASAAPPKKKGASLGEKIVAAILAAGPDGISCKDIAAKLEEPSSRNVMIWLATSAKKVKTIKKVGPAVWAKVETKGELEELPPLQLPKEKPSEESDRADVLFEEDEYQKKVKALPAEFGEADKVTVAKIQRKLKMGYQAALSLFDAMVDGGEIKEGLFVAKEVKI